MLLPVMNAIMEIFHPIIHHMSTLLFKLTVSLGHNSMIIKTIVTLFFIHPQQSNSKL